MSDQRPDDRIASGLPAPPPTGIQPELSAPAPLPSLAGDGRAGDAGEGLSSLAQSARAKHINTARTILFIIGGLTIVAHLVSASMGQSQIDAELRKQGLNPNNLPPDMQALVRIALMIHWAVAGGFVLMGAVFIGLGVMVRKYPVPCTIAGLALFILGALIQLLLDPASLAFGWIIKLIIVVALFKAVQAAMAAEREKRQALAEMDHAF